MVCCINLILFYENNIVVYLSYQEKQETATSWMPCILDNKELVIHPGSQTLGITRIHVISTFLFLFSLEIPNPV